MSDVPLTPPRAAPSPGQNWLRQYPPLATLVVALLIAFLVLPSALNLPQSNPSTILEFAPVPPEDDTPPTQEGSLSTLGLGSSNSLTTDTSPPVAPVTGRGRGGSGDRPSVKRCVGNPPRQTEDPNAPPCVPYFEGDNGGNTWQGVSGNEITVLIYASAHGTTGGDEGREETPPTGTYCDVDAPANTKRECIESVKQTKDHKEVRVARAMSRYFNDRFMTYDRHVHFWIYWTASQATGSTRRADAQANWERHRPFAVIDRAFFGGYNAVYATSMVRRGVSVYGNFSSLANRYFRDNAPYIWGFWPDVEHAVEQYVTYICARVAPLPVTYAGDDKQTKKMNGGQRKYGYLFTSDPGYEGLQYFARLAKQKFEQPCPNGIRIADSVVGEYKFPRHQYQIDTHPDAARVARENVAKMVSDGVTTVLWLQGYEAEHSKHAEQAAFYPEWILAGDLLNDSNPNAREQNQRVWAHAWAVSNTLREDSRAESPCRQAFREASPQGTNSDETTACNVYRAFFMLFRGIQAAGPYLSPETIDQGNHAIPRQASTNPAVAACFFDPGDYTCVKDAQESWWSPNAPDPGGSATARGCWRMVNSGKRYLAGEWPSGQDVFRNQQDICNYVVSDTFWNPYGPAG